MAIGKSRKIPGSRRSQQKLPETVFVTTIGATSGIPDQSATTEIPVKTLADSFHATIAALEATFAEAALQTIGPLAIDEITVGLAVSADGHVSLLGSGATVAGSASIRLKFTRRRR
jgi:hypothetical protein